MWKEFVKTKGEYYKKLDNLERKYQRDFNQGKDDVFFAWVEGHIIGIDWKDCRSNKQGHLIHDSEIEGFGG